VNWRSPRSGVQPSAAGNSVSADPPVKRGDPGHPQAYEVSLLISVISVRQASLRTEPRMHSRGGVPLGAGKVSGQRSGCHRPLLHGLLTFRDRISSPRVAVLGTWLHGRMFKRVGEVSSLVLGVLRGTWRRARAPGCGSVKRSGSGSYQLPPRGSRRRVWPAGMRRGDRRSWLR
jgi:hypothetical protein